MCLHKSTLTVIVCMFATLRWDNTCDASLDAKRLYDDLFRKGRYSKLIRPVANDTDRLTIRFGLRLSQIIDMDEKNQIMTTNMWLIQEWYDLKLAWNPAEYGNVTRLHVPSGEIWLPDIVLYNSADGNFTVKLMNKATLYSTGKVVWQPPAIYKSSCSINVEFFPFDEQVCMLKFGSWTYDGNSVDLQHIEREKTGAGPEDQIDIGIDLTSFYSSTEWAILAVPAKKYTKFYTCCSEPYPDIKFHITLRRKTLFYTVNLILPCVAICLVTVLVFYIPSDSGEKITMCITILNSLNMLFLLVSEINPPTSLATPLIGKYLIFTMVLVTLSIMTTVFVLNVHFRSPRTHTMSPWIQKVFLKVLPKLLLMDRPSVEKKARMFYARCYERDVGLRDSFSEARHIDSREVTMENIHAHSNNTVTDDFIDDENTVINEVAQSQAIRRRVEPEIPPNLQQAIEGIRYIADTLKDEDDLKSIKQDWKFVAMVLDRLFLWIFTTACVVGSYAIILQAPSLYDTRVPLG